MTHKVTAPAREGLPAGMVAWNGGDRAPADWDGGEVWLRDKSLHAGTADLDWQHFGDEVVDGDCDIIAYTPRVTPPEPSSEVVDAAQFLSDRLDDLEWMDGALEDTLREYMGHVDPAHARLKSALTALATRQPTPAPADDAGVRDGWKLVPVEPTRTMQEAGTADNAAITANYDNDGWRDVTRAIWAAMLAASPKAPSVAIGAREVAGRGRIDRGASEALGEMVWTAPASEMAPASASIPADVERAIAQLRHWEDETPIYAGDDPRAVFYCQKRETIRLAIAALAARPSTGGAMDGEGSA